MAVTQIKDKLAGIALINAITNTNHFQLAFKACGNTDNHVVEQCTNKTLNGTTVAVQLF